MQDDFTDEERDEIANMKTADHVANMLMKRGNIRVISAARPVLTRIPEHTLAEVDAMAKMAGKSRNALVIQLLSVGIEAVRERMDDDSLGSLNVETIQRQMELTDEQTTEREQLEA